VCYEVLHERLDGLITMDTQLLKLVSVSKVEPCTFSIYTISTTHYTVTLDVVNLFHTLRYQTTALSQHGLKQYRSHSELKMTISINR
jgi:hypothetical protein